MSKQAVTDVPLVSVIMPAYNHERFVEEAVRSVWSQSYARVELIVLNDGSTDKTGEVVDRLLAESPIEMKVIHKENEGLCATLNRGLKVVDGDYLAILASDDVMEPDKLSREVASLEKMPHIVAGCYGDMQEVDENGDVLRYTSYAPADPQRDAFLSFLLRKRRISIQASLFRTEVVRQLGGFDEKLRFEDVDFILRLLREYKLEYIGGLSVYYRRVQTGLSTQVIDFAQDHIAILEKHLDAPQLSALRPFAKRRVKAVRYLGLAKLSFLNRQETSARAYSSHALSQWPADLKVLIWWVVVRLPRHFVEWLLRQRSRT